MTIHRARKIVRKKEKGRQKQLVKIQERKKERKKERKIGGLKIFIQL